MNIPMAPRNWNDILSSKITYIFPLCLRQINDALSTVHVHSISCLIMSKEMERIWVIIKLLSNYLIGRIRKLRSR
jgi:hypothetical protein